MAGSKVYRVAGGKRTRLSRNKYTSARRNATGLRVGVGSGRRGAWRGPTLAETLAWKPKRGRRKLGARRKLTLIEQIVRWVKVPTGRVRRQSRRR